MEFLNFLTLDLILSSLESKVIDVEEGENE